MSETIDYPRTATPEEVWAALREIAERQKETERLMKENAEQHAERQKEIERIIKENAEWKKESDRQYAQSKKEADRQYAQSKKEADRQYAQSKKEADRQYAQSKKEADQPFAKAEKMLADLTKQMGDLHNTFGELAEHLVAPGIADRFNELGYHFDSVLPGGIRIRDEQGKIKTEIDLLLENGEYIVAVEVKSKPKVNDLQHHIRRLEILKEHREKRQEKPKIIMGAIAGAIFGLTEKTAATDAGFFALEQSGDTMKMIIPNNFKPRQW